MKFDDVKVGDVFETDVGCRFIITFKGSTFMSYILEDGLTGEYDDNDWNKYRGNFQPVSNNKRVILLAINNWNEDDEEDLQLSRLCIKRANSSSFKSHEEAWKKQHKRQVMTSHKEWK